jgi:hypothetical protein
MDNFFTLEARNERNLWSETMPIHNFGLNLLHIEASLGIYEKIYDKIPSHLPLIQNIHYFLSSS